MTAVAVSSGVCDRCRGFLFSGGFVVDALPQAWDGYAHGQRLALCAACFAELEAVARRCGVCGTCECNHGTDVVSAGHPFDPGGK